MKILNHEFNSVLLKPLLITFIGATAVIGAVGFKVKSDIQKSTEEKQKQEEISKLTADDLFENIVKDTLPSIGEMSLTVDYKGVPFAIEASTVSDGKVTVMSGRSAVDPKDNAFNNYVSQYVEQIGNITTFYTQNPDDDESYGDTWIKETLAQTSENIGYSSFADIKDDLENPVIEEDSKDDSYSVYLITGKLSADMFPKYF